MSLSTEPISMSASTRCLISTRFLSRSLRRSLILIHLHSLAQMPLLHPSMLRYLFAEQSSSLGLSLDISEIRQISIICLSPRRIFSSWTLQMIIQYEYRPALPTCLRRYTKSSLRQILSPQTSETSWQAFHLSLLKMQ